MVTPDEPRSCGDLQGDAQSSSSVSLAPGVEIGADRLRFTFARSSGPGGQNVNKRSTKALLRVGLEDIPINGAALRRLERLAPTVGGVITDEGELLLTGDETRSQRRNRDACLERLRELVVRALTPPKPRKKTRPSKGSVERRLEAKSQRSEVKRRRRRSKGDEG